MTLKELKYKADVNDSHDETIISTNSFEDRLKIYKELKRLNLPMYDYHDRNSYKDYENYPYVIYIHGDYFSAHGWEDREHKNVINISEITFGCMKFIKSVKKHKLV